MGADGSWITEFPYTVAISRKRCKIEGKLLLITNRKSYMSFQLVPKLVTLNDREWRSGVILRCFSEFGYLPGALRLQFMLNAWLHVRVINFCITIIIIKVHVHYLIYCWVLVITAYSTFTERKIRWYCCTVYIMGNFNNISAVGEMGDRGHNRHGPKKRVGAAVVISRQGWKKSWFFKIKKSDFWFKSDFFI